MTGKYKVLALVLLSSMAVGVFARSCDDKCSSKFKSCQKSDKCKSSCKKKCGSCCD